MGDSGKNSGVDFGIDSWEESSVEGSRKNYGVGFGVDSRTDSSVDDSADDSGVDCGVDSGEDSSVEDSGEDSVADSGIGFKKVDFPLVFQWFWEPRGRQVALEAESLRVTEGIPLRAGSGGAVQNRSAVRPRGGFRDPFYHLKNPLAKSY